MPYPPFPNRNAALTPSRSPPLKFSQRVGRFQSLPRDTPRSASYPVVRRNLNARSYTTSLVQTNKELSYTPESHSDRYARRHHHTGSHPYDSKSTSIHTRSLEENLPNFLQAKKKSLSKRLERSPSPITNIDQLRKVLAGGSTRVRESVPKIEINGEKVFTPATVSTPDEKEAGDVTLILDSLNVNGEWKEKRLDNLNAKAESGIRPPYGV